jgi:hypothetical protein
MGIPRKGSRKVNVDGKEFRYLIRQDGPVVENADPSYDYKPRHRTYILVTVQEDVEKPGNILQWRWPYGASVYPEDIRSAVRLAMERGWKPSDRGPTFVLGDA